MTVVHVAQSDCSVIYMYTYTYMQRVDAAVLVLMATLMGVGMGTMGLRVETVGMEVLLMEE